MTLRGRVRLLVLLMALASALLLGAVLFIADEWVEDAAIDDLLEAEMDRMLATGVQAAPALDESAMLQFLRTAPGTSPERWLDALPEGVTQDIEVGGRTYWVLVRALEGAERAYVLYHAERIERREHRLWWISAAAITVLMLLALAYGGRLANLALAPFDRLARQIRDLDPKRRGQRLAAVPDDAEIDAIRDSINAHLEKVDAALEHERAFAAAASHELRGPLSVIQGSAEVLREDATPAQRPSLDRLGRATRQSREIMEALLALTRQEDTLRAEPLTLVSWLPEAAEGFLRDAPRVAVRWQLQSVTLLAQPGAARVVFTNLLRNALQATAQGEIVITLDDGGISIDDNGPGIPAEALSQVFSPGFRLRDGGSGMGLYIARSVARRNGWSIELTNRPEGGVRARWRFAPAAS